LIRHAQVSKVVRRAAGGGNSAFRVALEEVDGHEQSKDALGRVGVGTEFLGELRRRPRSSSQGVDDAQVDDGIDRGREVVAMDGNTERVSIR
jgi:hypothetical protein